MCPLIQSKRISCTPFFEIKLYVTIDNDIKNKNYNKWILINIRDLIKINKVWIKKECWSYWSYFLATHSEKKKKKSMRETVNLRCVAWKLQDVVYL